MGRSHHQSEHGLTLVELLVVLIVMGLVSGLIVLSIPSGDDEAYAEAEALAAELSQLSDLAILEGRPYGASPSMGGVQIFSFYAGAWVTVTELAPASSDLDAPSLTVMRDESFDLEELASPFPPTRLSPRRRPAARSATGPDSPAIQFFPTGEATPATISLGEHMSGGLVDWQVRVAPNGDVIVEERPDDVR